MVYDCALIHRCGLSGEGSPELGSARSAFTFRRSRTDRTVREPLLSLSRVLAGRGTRSMTACPRVSHLRQGLDQ